MIVEEKHVYYVYIHRRKSDKTPFYVGVGKGKRCRNFSNRSKWWKAIREKHGVEVEILKDEMSFEESRNLEVATIKRMRQEGERLCNITDGGGGRRGFKLSDEVKAQIAKSNMGKNKGKKASEETRKLLSAIRTGKKHAPESIRKMSESQKGRPKKNPPPMKGKKTPESVKEKLRGPKSESHKEKLRKAALKRLQGFPHPSASKIVYKFENVKSGKTFEGTREDFKSVFGFSVKDLFGNHKKVQKTKRGWRVIA